MRPIVRIESISSPEGFLIDRAGQGYADRIDSFTIEQLRQGASINVAFKPAQAGGYYGTLVIRYGDGSTRNVILKGWAYESGTIIAAGDVSGTWSRDKSPYFVTGQHPRFPKDGQLEIEPGVKVLFTGSYGLTAGAERQADCPGQRGTADRAHRVEPRDGLGRPAICELGLG